MKVVLIHLNVIVIKKQRVKKLSILSMQLHFIQFMARLQRVVAMVMYIHGMVSVLYHEKKRKEHPKTSIFVVNKKHNNFHFGICH